MRLLCFLSIIDASFIKDSLNLSGKSNSDKSVNNQSDHKGRSSNKGNTYQQGGIGGTLDKIYGQGSKNSNNGEGMGMNLGSLSQGLDNNKLGGTGTDLLTGGKGDQETSSPSVSGGGGTGMDINAMLDAVNKVRQQNGSKPLLIDEKLNKAAKIQSEYQAQTKKMGHSGQGGSNVSDRCKSVGFSYSSVAENVAYGQKSVNDVMNSWVNSQGHFKNIIGKGFTSFGAANVDNYWTQVFASN